MGTEFFHDWKSAIDVIPKLFNEQIEAEVRKRLKAARRKAQ
jgi:hypothetical protein